MMQNNSHHNTELSEKGPHGQYQFSRSTGKRWKKGQNKRGGSRRKSSVPTDGRAVRDGGRVMPSTTPNVIVPASVQARGTPSSAENDNVSVAQRGTLSTVAPQRFGGVAIARGRRGNNSLIPDRNRQAIMRRRTDDETCDRRHST